MNRTIKKVISVITTLSMCVAMIGIMPVLAADSAFSGGSGTQDNPYLISTKDDLINFGANVADGNTYAGKYVKLTQDIILSEETEESGNPKNFIPIGADNDHMSYGDSHKPFEGVFDGDGHKIDRMVQHYASPSSFGPGYDCLYDYYYGLFAFNKGTIKNLSVSGDINIYGTDLPEYIGGIAACNEGVIENCSYEGKIGFSYSLYNIKYIGGIVGFNSSNATIKNCSNLSEISAKSIDVEFYIGGITGWNEGNAVLNCHNTGTITVSNDEFTTSGESSSGPPHTVVVGGIVGSKGDVQYCCNTGTITDNTVGTTEVHINPTVGYEGMAYYSYSGMHWRDALPASVNSDDSIVLMADDVTDGSILKTDEEFASGEVTYLLNNSSSTGSLAWYQTLGANGDAIPTLDSSHGVVCYDAGSGTYSNQNKITFVNYDGTVLQTSGMADGEMPSYTGATPTKPSEGTTAYTFSGWSPEITVVNGDATYTAQYTSGVVEVNRNIYVDFMGIGDSPGEGKKSGNLNNENINDTFWVGVAVDKVNDLNLFTDGVYSLELAFEYDPNFVRPDIKDDSGNINGTETEKDDRWNAKIAKVNIDTSTETGKIWNSNYSSTSVYDSEIDWNADRANADNDLREARKNWKMCTVSVTLTEKDAQNISFKDLLSADKQYLLKLPFTLVGVPPEGAADPNPIVLSLIRGPETFDIGSGANGEMPNAKWNETENQGELNNLKTHFGFAGDVRLFGETVSIEDIIPFRMVPKLDGDGNPMKDPDDKIIEEEETYTLSQDNTLSGEGFAQEVSEYYLSISNDPDNLQLRIKTDSQPYIYLNGSTTPIVTSSVTGGYVTAVIPLKELDVSTKDQDNGFNNTISIRDDPSATDSLYTIYVRRLLKPKIELNYGNSPYGEIMKAANIAETDKAEAKRLFNENGKSGVESKYSKAENGKYFPAGLEDRADVIYLVNAWVDVANIRDITQAEQDAINDPEINMDRNDYAIFVYGDRKNEVELQDTGFTAYNSLGEIVDANQVTRTITVQQYTESRGISGNVKSEPFVFENDIENGVTWAADAVLPGVTAWDKRAIRPDIYTLYYSFDDPNDSNGGKAERKIIYLPKRYDTNVDLVVNGGDPTYTVSASKGSFPFNTDTPETTQRLYKFRVIDGNMDAVINGGDVTFTKSAAKGSSTGGNYVQFYR